MLVRVTHCNFITMLVRVDDLLPLNEREGGEEPEWLQSEREQFKSYRDKDGNGRLDLEEIGDWVMPKEYDHAHAEVNHLMYQADANKVSSFRKHC